MPGVPISIDDALGFALGVVVIAELAVVVTRWPSIGVWSVAAVALLAASGFSPSITFDAIQVYPMDLVTLVLSVAVAAHLLRFRASEVASKAFLALVLVALFRGVLEFGVEPAVNASRGLLYVAVVATYCAMCAGPRAWVAIQRSWPLATALLAIVAVVFFAKHGLGSYAAHGDRALNARQALVVGQTAVMAMARTSRRARTVAASCFALLLACQQRTAWFATAVAVLVVAVKAKKLRNERVRWFVRRLIPVGVIALGALVLAGPAGLRSSLGEATTNISTSSGTFGWRVQSWSALIDAFEAKPVIGQLFGQPFGAGFSRVIRGIERTESPHNMYITVLLSLGMAGLAVLVWAYLSALRRSVSSSIVMHALVWSIVVFSSGYQIEAEQALILGAALSVGRVRAPASAPSAVR